MAGRIRVWQSGDGRVRLFRADARLVLRSLQDRCVGVVVTDPPYDEQTHAGARTRTVGPESRSLVPFPPLGTADIVDVFGHLVRVAARWVVATVEWRHAAAMDAAGLPLVRLGAWVKPNGSPQFSGDRPATGWEAVAMLHRPEPLRWNGGGRRGVWTVNRADAKWNETEKPLALVEDFVRLFSDPGELVLDPFLGGATTAIACLRTGRPFVGIEIRDDAFDRAVERVERELARPVLPGCAEHEAERQSAFRFD